MSGLSEEVKLKLSTVAKSIVANGKGILAADESPPTAGKRFVAFGLDNTEENRRRFREMLFTTPGLENYCGGIIFIEETFYQKDSAGVPFVKLVKDKGINVGIKVDRGLIQQPGGVEGEMMTKGFDDLDERMKRFAKEGATFAKWRCVSKISASSPTEANVRDVAHTLAKYAKICQDNGIVPIVEPEVLLDGDHDLERGAKVTEHVLSEVYSALHLFGVYLEGSLLKPNMVTAGQACTKKYTPEQVAETTVSVLSRTVPAAVVGITFLSGGQSEVDATKHLNAINLYKGPKPWALTFSFARALQNSCVAKWAGKDENVAQAQEILKLRAAFNSKAAQGTYKEEMETDEAAKKSLFVAGHVY